MANQLEWIALGALLARGPEALQDTETRLWSSLEIRQAIEALPQDARPLRYLLEGLGCVWAGGRAMDAVMETLTDRAMEWHSRRLFELDLDERLGLNRKAERQIVEATLDKLRRRALSVEDEPGSADGKTTGGSSGAASGIPTAGAPSTPPKSPKPPHGANHGSPSSKPSGKDSGKSGKRS